jgi:lysophospholipase L1-like esterase
MISRSQSASRRAAVLSLLAGAVVAVLSFAAPGRAEASAIITWRVENPFRFFTNPKDTEAHRVAYRSLGPEQRATPVLSEERLLQANDPEGWASSMYRDTCWHNNRFKCAAYDDYINPKSHAVIFKAVGIDTPKMLSCTWLTAPRDSDQPRGKAVTQPCDEPVRFVIPYPMGAIVSVEIGGLEVAKADVKVRDILVVGMGDSFASGDGNPDVAVRFSRKRSADYSTVGLYSGLSGYPARVGPWREFGDTAFQKENARWLDQACHRSLYSEQSRTALQLAIEDPHRAVTFVGVSCAGAEITDGLFLRYKGNEWVPNPPRYSQISAVAQAQCGNSSTAAVDAPEAYHINGQVPELKDIVLRKCPQDVARKIDLVLVSIGGNDIGFSRLLANAVLSNESILRELGGWLGEVHGEAEASAELSHLGARYKALNRALHNILYMPWDESDRILLVAYPGLALQGDGSDTCGSGNAGMEVVPDFHLDRTKLRLGTWFADKLNRQMRESANTFGWTYVETHRRTFIGRGICAGLSVQGVSQVDDLRLPRKVNGVWTPYNPADYLPYASRQRWFRTPNDAFMTANFHVAAGLLTKVLKIEPLAPLQLLIASTYSGAFHPTAEGQAAIADAVVDKARAVLRKYGQGPDNSEDLAISSDDDPLALPLPDTGPKALSVKAVVSGPNDVQSGSLPPTEDGQPETKAGLAPVPAPLPSALPAPAQPSRHGPRVVPATDADIGGPAPAMTPEPAQSPSPSQPLASPPSQRQPPPVDASTQKPLPPVQSGSDNGLGEAKAILAPTQPAVGAPTPVVGGAPAADAKVPDAPLSLPPFDTKAEAARAVPGTAGLPVGGGGEGASASPVPAPPAAEPPETGALPETAIRPFAPASGGASSSP